MLVRDNSDQMRVSLFVLLQFVPSLKQLFTESDPEHPKILAQILSFEANQEVLFCRICKGISHTCMSISS